jgi:molybdopterin-guanine dinucleotide biosynthesis protein A
MMITGIILAGGKSTRMGHDKAFLQWEGKPFAQHVIDAAKPLCQKLLISGSQPELHEFGYPVVEDLRQFEGPVTALASCFKHVDTKAVLVLSCDVPQITTADLENLGNHHQPEYDVTLYSFQGKQMPLVAIYNRSSFQAFERAFKARQKKLFNVLDGLRVNVISFTGKQGLYNINTTKDLTVL